jgi:hypothetical protein
MRAFSDGEFSATAALFVRNRTRNVRAPVVLSFVTSSDARSSNSLSQPDRLSSQEKFILLTSRIRAHAGPARRRTRSHPQKLQALARQWTSTPSVRGAILYHIGGPRVSAIRASPSSPVDRNLKKPLGQGRNPSSCLKLRGSPAGPETAAPYECFDPSKGVFTLATELRTGVGNAPNPTWASNSPKSASLARIESSSTTPRRVHSRQLAGPACSPAD